VQKWERVECQLKNESDDRPHQKGSKKGKKKNTNQHFDFERGQREPDQAKIKKGDEGIIHRSSAKKQTRSKLIWWNWGPR